MHKMFLALLCAAPLMAGYGAYESPQPVVPAAEPAAAVETVYLTSMGCDVADCTDPTHYHCCPADCADPAHYHNCPVGCADPAHPYCGRCWEESGTVSSEFCPSMGCVYADCTDPAHYHHCPAGCTDPAHCHDCPVGCQNAGHLHGATHHRGGRGHHGWGHH